MSSHAFLAPSAAAIWVNCALYPTVAPHYPDLETEDSRVGSAAHWVIAEVLATWVNPERDAAHASQYLGATSPEGVVIDSGIVQGAEVFIQEALAICQKHGALRSMLIEFLVRMPNVHPSQNWGTLDLAIPVYTEKVLYVMDYKHGRREVKARENWQLTDYAEGVGELLRSQGITEQDWRVVFVIVQPNCYTSGGAVNYWETSFNDLRGATNLLTHAATLATSNPVAKAGKWCRDCPAARDCGAATAAVYDVIEHCQRPPDVFKMTPGAMAVYYWQLKDAMQMLKGVTAGIEDAIDHAIKSGQPVPGIKLETANGREVWDAPRQQVLAICEAFGVDADLPTLKTPKQVRDAAPAKVKDALTQSLNGLTTVNRNGLKLIDARDSNAARVFGK